MYRKPEKPKRSAKTIKGHVGWPFNDVKAANPPSAEQNDVDILITEYEKKDNFMDNVEGAAKLAMFLLFVVMVAGAFYGAAYVDDLNREECVRGGGRVVEVHGARPSGFTAPWMCQR